MRRISLVLLGAMVGAGTVIMASQPFLPLGTASAANSETYRQLNLFGDVDAFGDADTDIDDRVLALEAEADALEKKNA